MIKFRVPINDADETIIAPSVISIVNRLKQVFHLDKHAKLSLENSESPYINDNWSLGDTTDSSNSNAQTSIDVTYSVEYEPGNLKSTDTRRNRSKPILYSSETRFKVNVLYIESKLVLTLKISSASKNRLNTILNELRVRAIDNRDVISHDLVYYFYLQNYFKSLISNFNYNRNYKLGTNTTNEEYLSELVDDRFTLLGTISGDLSKTALGFKEVRSGAFGRFTSDMINNKKSYNKDDGVWETDLEYEVVFKQPMFYDVEYYRNAYQYKLDDAFTTTFSTESTPSGRMDTYEELLDQFGYSKYLLDTVLNLNEKFDYVRIPKDDVDAELPRKVFYTDIFSVNVTLTNEDNDLLFNLTDIPDFKLNDNIVTMLKDSEYKHSNSMFYSCFLLSMYNYDERLSEDTIYIDEYLNVRLREDLDATGNYRVGFGLNTDLTKLYNPARERLLELYPEFIDTLSELSDNIYFTGFERPGTTTMFYLQRSYIISKILRSK
jgi:hypothetical protein